MSTEVFSRMVMIAEENLVEGAGGYSQKPISEV